MGTLTTFAPDPLLDLPAYKAQRQCTFKFYRSDAVTHERLGQIYPLRDQAPTLEHDTSRTIKRQMTIVLGTRDTALVDPIKERVELFMVFPNGREEPLGRYMYSNPSLQKYKDRGDLGTFILTDEMFIVDQPILQGITGFKIGIPAVIAQVMTGLNIQYEVEVSPYVSSQAWTIGTNRGQVLEALCVAGSYFNPWFDNNGKMRFIRAFNAADRICDFDFDSGYKVIRESITHTDDLLSAPNVYLVTANASDQGETAPVVGSARIAPTAPNSVENRGFEVVSYNTMQVANSTQAQAIAYGLVQRNSTLENVTLATAPDPRHDGYNVVRFDGSNWLEIAWSMTLTEGGLMNHTLRKTYGV
jgi:hypothetical protein